MAVRAKFKVTEIAHYECHDKDAVNVAVKLEAVTSGDGNESWSKWTPAGQLTMTVTNPAAVADFKVGSAYYLDLDVA